jgi:hypothetical protein
MVTIDGRLIAPRQVELTEPVPRGVNSLQVRLIDTKPAAFPAVALLVHNPSFDFLHDEPDRYG